MEPFEQIPDTMMLMIIIFFYSCWLNLMFLIYFKVFIDNLFYCLFKMKQIEKNLYDYLHFYASNPLLSFNIYQSKMLVNVCLFLQSLFYSLFLSFILHWIKFKLNEYPVHFDPLLIVFYLILFLHFNKFNDTIPNRNY